MILTYRRLLLPALLLSFIIYLIAVSSFPVTILMGQGYDDALFIRLGRNIANGQWLGPYNELTLFKAPMYPVFLAGFSLTGIPFNIAQHCIYFFGCLYVANVISRSCDSSTIGIMFFVVALCCPTYYAITRVTREPLYTALTLFLVGCWIDLFLLGRPNQHRFVFSACVGVLSTVYYLTREEGIWILPSLTIIALGSLASLAPAASTPMRTRSWRLCSRLLVVALFASLTAGGIGLLNWAFYGRFVVIEMSDADFQKAMAALQRVGALYERPYLPLPREARQLLYAESPLFASLKSVLDPRESENPWNNAACRILPSTCGDIGGGLFMWALRDAAGKVGMHEAPQKAAVFYRTLASEVGSACETARLGCSAWLPALIPAIPTSQWEKLPGAFLKAVSLPLFWLPPPIPPIPPVSDLASPDAPEALEFLNRPYHVLADPDAPPQTKALIRAASLQVLQAAVKMYALVTAAGILSFLLAVGFWPRRLMRDPIFIILAALIIAVLARSFLLALIHISSFPAIFHVRMLPTEPLAICAALLAIYLFISLARKTWFHRSTST